MVVESSGREVAPLRGQTDAGVVREARRRQRRSRATAAMVLVTAAVLIPVAATGGSAGGRQGSLDNPSERGATQQTLSQAREACRHVDPKLGAARPILSSAPDASFTLLVYLAGGIVSDCFTGGGLHTSVSGGGIGASTIRGLTTDAGEGALTLTPRNVTPGVPGPLLRYIQAQTVPGVTRVAVTLANGQHARVVLKGRWFVAWWRGTQGARSITLSTAGRTTTQPEPPPFNQPIARRVRRLPTTP